MQLQFSGGGQASGIGAVMVGYARGFAMGGNPSTVVRKTIANDAVAQMFERAVTNPIGLPGDEAMGALVSEQVLAYVRALPGSLAAALARRVLGVDVSSGPVVVPGRDLTASNGSAAWTRPGDAVPVVTLNVAGVKLDAYKAASITVMSVELARNPAAQPVIEQLQRNDVVDALDAALLDGAGGDDSRPPSLLFGAVEVASSGDMLADLTALFAAVPRATDAVMMISRAAYLAAAATGLVMASGQIAGADVIVTDRMPADLMAVLFDAADVYVTSGSEFDISHSDSATLHMNSEALPFSDEAGTLASPVFSLWQHALLGVRVVLPVGWAAHPGRVAYLTETVTP